MSDAPLLESAVTVPLKADAHPPKPGNIFTGGDSGDSQVVFQIAPNDADTQFFTITMPVSVGSCLAAGSGVNVIVETAGGFVNNDADGDNTASAMNAPGSVSYTHLTLPTILLV